MGFLQELLLETRPNLHQTVPGNNVLETLRIEHSGLDELEQSELVLCTSGLESNGRKVFG